MWHVHVVQLNRKMKYLYIHLQTKHWSRVGARTGTLENPTKCLWRWEPDRRSYFFFSPHANLCAVTYMTEISLIVTLNKQFNSTQIRRSTSVMNEFTYDTFTHSVRLVSCVHMTKMKCKSTVPSMWFIHRHEMTQNVRNFSMCRANTISRMLYVNSVQLRIELNHVYPIAILSQTRRYSRKLQTKNPESYIITNKLYLCIVYWFVFVFRLMSHIFRHW